MWSIGPDGRIVKTVSGEPETENDYLEHLWCRYLADDLTLTTNEVELLVANGFPVISED